MAVHLAGGGRARGGRRRGYRPISDINVTPFVDVMLVLLIVFMVSAPLLTVGVPVDLPKTQARVLETPKDPLTVTVKPDGTVFVQEKQVNNLPDLVPLLLAISNNNPEARILIKGDQRLAYGRMMEVMTAINTAGFKKIGLVTELPAPSAASPGARPGAAPARPQR